MLLTASLFPFTCFGIGFALNTVAIFYHSLAAIPFGTMVSLVSLASFIQESISIYGVDCTSCTSQFQTVRLQTALI
jgi:transmembrane 9 superfamily protein 3